MKTTSIRTALIAAKGPWYPKDHQGQGFYALFLKQGCSLPCLEVAEDGLLYIGKTEKGFSARDQFDPKCGHSDSCTARRSLGALLKDQLQLSAEPRSRRSFFNRSHHFRFDEEGERALSGWMRAHLHIARVPFEGNVTAAETILIDLLCPPLNLTKWRNPQAPYIKRMRRRCASEARLFFMPRRLAA